MCKYVCVCKIRSFRLLRLFIISDVTKASGPRFNIKITSRKSHCGDKTILRPSYLHNGVSFTGNMTSLY